MCNYAICKNYSEEYNCTNIKTHLHDLESPSNTSEKYGLLEIPLNGQGNSFLWLSIDFPNMKFDKTGEFTPNYDLNK